MNGRVCRSENTNMNQAPNDAGLPGIPSNSHALLCGLCQIPGSVTLVHFLHLRSLISCTFDFLQRRQVVIVTKTLVVIINAETKIDHAVDTASKLSGLIKVEP